MIRRGAIAVIAVTTLLVAASIGSASVERGAVTTEATPLPEPGRTEVAGARWGRYLAVAGGLIAVGGGYEATSSLVLFDVRSGVWSHGPDLPGRRDHAALASLGDSLYLVGGYMTTLSGPTREAWRLDAPDGSWRRVADLSVPRGALAVVTVSGHLLAIGGTNARGVLRSTELYDPRADTWTPGPDLAIPREHTGAAVVGRRVYSIAGRNPANLTSVETLVVTNRGPRGGWSPAPELEFSRGGNGAATVDGMPCTAGGEEAAGTIAPIECLRDGRWVHVADLRVPRHGLAVVGEHGRLHIISGGPQPGATYSTAHEVLRV